jgi:uncharacterized protein YjeT (DUF2065 family)
VADSLWTALALVLVIEGLLPFAAPRVWREAVGRMSALGDGQLRFVGLLSIAAGVASLLIMSYA